MWKDAEVRKLQKYPVEKVGHRKQVNFETDIEVLESFGLPKVGFFLELSPTERTMYVLGDNYDKLVSVDTLSSLCGSTSEANVRVRIADMRLKLHKINEKRREDKLDDLGVYAFGYHKAYVMTQKFNVLNPKPINWNDDFISKFPVETHEL